MSLVLLFLLGFPTANILPVTRDDKTRWQPPVTVTRHCHCHTVMLSLTHCHTLTLSHCETVTLSLTHCDAVTLSHCHTVTDTLSLTHCHCDTVTVTVTLWCCDTVTDTVRLSRVWQQSSWVIPMKQQISLSTFIHWQTDWPTVSKYHVISQRTGHTYWQWTLLLLLAYLSGLWHNWCIDTSWKVLDFFSIFFMPW